MWNTEEKLNIALQKPITFIDGNPNESKLNENTPIMYNVEDDGIRHGWEKKLDGGVQENQCIMDGNSDDKICASVASEDEPPVTWKRMEYQQEGKICKEMSIAIYFPVLQYNFNTDSLLGLLVSILFIDMFIRSVICLQVERHTLHKSRCAALAGHFGGKLMYDTRKHNLY